jgi:hypothetical protein
LASRSSLDAPALIIAVIKLFGRLHPFHFLPPSFVSPDDDDDGSDDEGKKINK